MAYPSYGAGSPLAGGASPTAESTYVDLFKTAYADTIRMKTQNTDSVLSDTCIPEVLFGDPLMLDSYKAVDNLVQRDRNQQYGAESNDLKYETTGNERRQLTPEFWEFAEMFDPRDERALMRAIQPDGMYIQNVAAAFNRKKDDVILDRFLGDVTINGVALAGGADTREHLTSFRKDSEAAYGGAINETAHVTGDGAATTVTRTGNIVQGAALHVVAATGGTTIGPLIVGTLGEAISRDATACVGQHGAQNVVLGDLGTLGTRTEVTDETTPVTTTISPTDVDSRGLHIKKLMIAHQILQANGAANLGQPIVCVLHPEQVTQLLQEAKYTSADYNALMPLQYGQAVPFLGMEFRVCNQIATEAVVSGVASGSLTAASAGRYAYVYTQDANVFGQGDEMSVRFDEIPQRGYSLQCYHDFSLGGVRMDAKKMVIIPCHAGTGVA